MPEGAAEFAISHRLEAGIFLHPDDVARVSSTFEHAVHSGGDRLELDFRIVRQDDGGVRTFKSLNRFSRTPDGRPLRATGINIDVTALAQARAAGLSTLAYTVNDAAQAQTLRRWGVDSLITDRVDRFRP